MMMDYTAPIANYGTPVEHLYRQGGPDTSQEAAESIYTTELEEIVHYAISSFGNDGCIADQVLSTLDNLSYSSVTARFSALERKGLIECGPDKRKGASGRNQRVMRSV